jgi:hypothetical protein
VTELPHIEAKDGNVWIDGVSYTPAEAFEIAVSTQDAARVATCYRFATITHGRELPAHDSERDERSEE